MTDEIHFGKNELIARAGEKIVLAGKMQPSAIDDLVALYGPKCIIDTKANTITLDGDPLDVAVEKLLATDGRAHWRPVEVVDPKETSLRADQALAVAGNLSALGRVRRTFGGDRDPQATAAFDKWCAGHGVRAGKAPLPNGDDKHKTNPWSNSPGNLDARGRYSANAMARQSALAKVNPTGAAEIAAKVGSKLGDTRPA